MGLFRLAASKRKSAMSSLAALCSGVAISNFGWVRCRVYIGPLHPTNFSIVKVLKVAVRIALLLALVHLLNHPLVL